MPLLRLALGIVLVLGAWPASAAPSKPGSPEVIPFDVKNYPRTRIHRVLRNNRCDKSPYSVKDVIFSTEMTYQGATRPTPRRRYELIRRWTQAIGDPKAAVRYRQEVSAADWGKTHWLVIPEGLMNHMRVDLMVGDRIIVYLVFVGCERGRPVFAIDEFEDIRQTDEEAADILI